MGLTKLGPPVERLATSYTSDLRNAEHRAGYASRQPYALDLFDYLMHN